MFPFLRAAFENVFHDIDIFVQFQPFGLKLCKDNSGDQYNELRILVFRAVGLLVGGGLQPILGRRRRRSAASRASLFRPNAARAKI